MRPSLHPFRAVRYAPEGGSGGREPGEPGEPTADLSLLLAPPYDVIGPQQARGLRDRNPRNVVRLILPEGDSAERYRDAARLLRSWIESGVLVRDSEPAAYVYAQEFRHGGETLVRRSVFTALDLLPLDAGGVIPHEETHGEPKRDRTALLEATGVQLSPVFLLARDGRSRLAALLEEAEGRPPVIRAETPDGERHQVWRLTPDRDGRLLSEILSRASADPLLIADGHHRYETSLEMSREGAAGEIAPSRILACVASARDPGLLILPTHRVLLGPPAGGSWAEALRSAFRMERVPAATPAEYERRADSDGGSMLVWLAGRGECWRLAPRPEVLESAEAMPEEGPGGAELAPVVFDRHVLRHAYGMDADTAVRRGLLEYHRDPERAAASAAGADTGSAAQTSTGSGAEARAGEARAGEGAVFFLPTLRLDDVWRYCATGRRLPAKSTYFWPKIPSGLLFRPVEK